MISLTDIYDSLDWVRSVCSLNQKEKKIHHTAGNLANLKFDRRLVMKTQPQKRFRPLYELNIPVLKLSHEIKIPMDCYLPKNFPNTSTRLNSSRNGRT